MTILTILTLGLTSLGFELSPEQATNFESLQLRDQSSISFQAGCSRREFISNPLQCL